MKECLKCVNINFLPEDIEKASKIPYVVEHETPKKTSILDIPPLCLVYGDICDGYNPCEECKNDKKSNFKERKQLSNRLE